MSTSGTPEAGSPLQASEVAQYLEYHPWPSYLWQRAGNDFVLVEANSAAERITQGSIKEHLGSTLEELFGDRPSILSMMRQCIRERRPMQHQIPYRFQGTGSLHDLNVTYVFVPPDLVVVHTEDVTATHREIRRQLQGLNRLRGIVDHLPDGIVALKAGRVWYANPGMSRLVDASPERLTGAPLDEWVHPEDREKLRRYRHHPDLLAEVKRLELRLGDDDAGWREVEVYVSSFSLEGEAVVVGVIRDHTEQKQRELELAAHRTRLEQSQRLARLAYWEWDLETETITWGREALRILGIDEERWDGSYAAALDRVHPADRRQVDDAVAAVREGRSTRYDEKYRMIRDDGTVVPVHVLGELEHDDEGLPIRFHGAFQDVTELREKERALEASEERLRALALRAGERLEAERKRIARDLHDHLGQATVTIRMQLLYLRSMVEAAEVGIDAMATIDEAVEELDVMLEWSGRLARELRPDLLDRLGLGPALGWQLKRIEERTELDVRLDLDELSREPPEGVAVALFRIAQEAARNVIRHAEARTLALGLRYEDGAWTMVVEDDGRGMDDPTRAGALGILGMREQAVAVGGRFQLTSEPGGGTRLEVTIPMPSGRSEDEGSGRGA